MWVSDDDATEVQAKPTTCSHFPTELNIIIHHLLIDIFHPPGTAEKLPRAYEERE